MLSRVAERVYWMARYMERTENIARMVNAYMQLMLDLPKNLQPGWQQLIYVTGGNAIFYKHYRNPNERNTIKFLLADHFNPGSIYNSLSLARENLRTTRDIVPPEAFEHVNELYLYAKGNIESAIIRRGRYIYLSNLVKGCQQISGLLSGTMSHDTAYDFLRIGRNLERSDMTSRIVDVGAAVLLPRQEERQASDNILWAYLLKSLSADQMYRQHIRWRVEGKHVVRYLLRDSLFPRSVAHCLAVMVSSFEHLPRSDTAAHGVAGLQRLLNEVDIDSMAVPELHEFIDDLQTEMAKVHEHIVSTWFKLDQDVHPKVTLSAVQAS
jgi:uncharacterized alpha-E superfamily protein